MMFMMDPRASTRQIRSTRLFDLDATALFGGREQTNGEPGREQGEGRLASRPLVSQPSRRTRRVSVPTQIGADHQRIGSQRARPMRSRYWSSSAHADGQKLLLAVKLWITRVPKPAKYDRWSDPRPAPPRAVVTDSRRRRLLLTFTWLRRSQHRSAGTASAKSLSD
jgi:hypothetical protein